MSASLRIRFAAAVAFCLVVAAGALAEAARPTVLVFGLGTRCRYCVQLKKEIAVVTRTTGDAVRFTDILVDKDQELVRKYRVVLSPTLVFLDAGGTEVFRHQGMLDAAQLKERLVALKFWGQGG